MGLSEEDMYNTLLEMKMQLSDLQEKVEALIRCVEEEHNGPNKMGLKRKMCGLGNIQGMGIEVHVLLYEDGPSSKQMNLGPNQVNAGGVRLGPNQRHQKARLDPNLMGRAEGVQNKEKFRAETQLVWRVREGGEAGASAGENQLTSPVKELRYPSDPRETHRSREKKKMVQWSSLTAMEDPRDDDDEVEVLRTIGQKPFNPSRPRMAKESLKVAQRMIGELPTVDPEMDLNVFSLADVGSPA